MKVSKPEAGNAMLLPHGSAGVWILFVCNHPLQPAPQKCSGSAGLVPNVMILKAGGSLSVIDGTYHNIIRPWGRILEGINTGLCSKLGFARAAGSKVRTPLQLVPTVHGWFLLLHHITKLWVKRR